MANLSESVVTRPKPKSESGNAAFANASLVLSSKIERTIQDGGQRRKINPRRLGPLSSLCRRAGIDAALVRARLFRRCIIEQKFKTRT